MKALIASSTGAPPRASLALPLRLPQLRWPLPALLAWMAAIGVHGTLEVGGASPVAAWLAGVATGAAASLAVRGTMRRALVALGFPLAGLAFGVVQVPAWAWLLAALMLAAIYPLRAWRDAPLFPTPPDALAALAQAVPLPPGAQVLDAGCGLGHGLKALRAAWPQAQLHGVEWSRPLAWLCRLRCADALVRSGDLWRMPWGAFDAVYLFQRPESMPRAWAKACADMRPGSWLVSLEFEVAGVRPWARLAAGGSQATAPGPERPLWVYRVPAALPAGPRAAGAHATSDTPDTSARTTVTPVETLATARPRGRRA